jgi:metal-responsive CopG/Arc/MetJ family transcriptional regulator
VRTKTISVTIEIGLLAKADRMAKRLRISRANLIARGLRSVVESC